MLSAFEPKVAGASLATTSFWRGASPPGPLSGKGEGEPGDWVCLPQVALRSVPPLHDGRRVGYRPTVRPTWKVRGWGTVAQSMFLVLATPLWEFTSGSIPE